MKQSSEYDFVFIANFKDTRTIFSVCYLAAPQPPWGHYRGDSLTHPMLIYIFCVFKGYRELGDEVESL